MASYSYYSFDGAKLISAGRFIAPGDRMALAIGRRKGEGHALEIWREDRRLELIAAPDPRAT